MPDMTIMMSHEDSLQSTGPACQADGWYDHRRGYHTIAIQVTNFTGRITVQASMALEPTEADWFDIKLTPSRYVEFPVNKHKPTGSFGTGGDTGSFGYTFQINALWLRAKMDRSYFVGLKADPSQVDLLGSIQKITLAR